MSQADWTRAFRFETPRLSLYPCDAPAAQELALIAQDPRVSLPYYAAPRESMHGPGEDWLQDRDGWQAEGSFTLAARERTGGQVIGAVQFTRESFSYFLHPACWGRGLGHEMVTASCAAMPRLLGIAALRATILRENLPSRRILEQAGFTFTGLSQRPYRGAASVALLSYRRAC